MASKSVMSAIIKNVCTIYEVVERNAVNKNLPYISDQQIYTLQFTQIWRFIMGE